MDKLLKALMKFGGYCNEVVGSVAMEYKKGALEYLDECRYWFDEMVNIVGIDEPNRKEAWNLFDYVRLAIQYEDYGVVEDMVEALEDFVAKWLAKRIAEVW